MNKNKDNHEKFNQSTEIMTEISARQWDFVTAENLTAKEAVAFLKKGMQLRSFTDNLREIYGAGDWEGKLVEGLCDIGEAESGSRPPKDNVRRKVRNWVTGKNIPTDRAEVFRICFALDLGLEQSDKLLSRLTEQGIHYRNGREMIAAYCLKHHLGYGSALALTEQFLNQRSAKDAYEEPVTHVLKSEFQKLHQEEDLLSFMLKHKMQMGSSHNTAYAYFCKMLALLSGEELEGEESYSMEYIADTYLRMNVPLDKRSSGYSNVQKIVKKYWPGARSVKAMKSRSEDVTRKMLLLLYIVTGGVWEEQYRETDEIYVGCEEFLEFHCRQMNQMLRSCGMSRIDPRNVFDYLILYCLRPEDDIFMSDRMALLMKEIFEDSVL